MQEELKRDTRYKQNMESRVEAVGDAQGTKCILAEALDLHGFEEQNERRDLWRARLATASRFHRMWRQHL